MFKVYYLIIFVCSLLFINDIEGQNGLIKGQVFDDTGTEFFGAFVYPESDPDNYFVETDLDGKFELELPTGTYNIKVEGFNFVKIIPSVVVANDDENDLGKIILQPEATMIEGGAVITARRIENTDNALIAEQQNSDAAMDATSSEAMSQSGASTASEGVQKVTGISIVGGKYVFVRGLSDRYTKTTLNDVLIPGLDPNNNTIELDIFPTSILDNIIVYKTYTADQPGDFAGGLVALNTKDYPSRLKFSAGASVGYNTETTFDKNFSLNSKESLDFLGFDNGKRALPSAIKNLTKDDLQQPRNFFSLEQKRAAANNVASFNNNFNTNKETALPNYSFNASLGNTTKLFKKDLGFIVGLNYNKSLSRYEDGIFARYNDENNVYVQDRQLTEDRSRESVLWSILGNTSLKINSNNKIGLTLLSTTNGINTNTNRLNGTSRQEPGNTFRTIIGEYSSRNLLNGSLNGKHILSDKLELNWSASGSQATLNSPDISVYSDFNINGSDLFRMDDNAGFSFPTKYFRNMKQFLNDNLVNLAYKYNLFNDSINDQLKFGARYTFSTREYTENQYEFKYEEGYDGNVSEFLTDKYLYTETNTDGIIVRTDLEAANNFDANQSIAAAYFMNSSQIFKKTKLLLGLRAEMTTINFTSFIDENSTNGTIVTSNTETLLEEIDFMPNIGIIQKIMKDDKANIRFNYARTIARPVYRELFDRTVYDVNLGTNVIGNFDLAISDIDNYDVKFELFPNAGELVSFGVFYKNFTNPIGLYRTPAGNFKYDNTDDGNIYGLEFEARKNLGFINDANTFLNNLAISTNVTLIESEVKRGDAEIEQLQSKDPNVSEYRAFFGQSPYIVNFYVDYATKKGTDVNIGYNIQGRKLALAGFNAINEDVYIDPVPTFSFKISQSLSKQWAINFGAKNIFIGNDPLTGDFRIGGANNILSYGDNKFGEQDGKNFIFSSFNPGVSFTLGVKYDLLTKEMKAEMEEYGDL